VIADGLTRNAVPPPLVGQCTLLQWQKLLDDLELAASSNSYNCACMYACLHPFTGFSLFYGVFPWGWLFPCVPLYLYYSTSPRNGNPVNGNHLDESLSFSQKNGNSLTWVLVALTVCFTYPVLYRVSSESRAGEWEL
jgi:hypothetical protein